jgi:predicted phage baseplate assembly protein
MPLLLPNLDDRQWADLVAESTALIPVYGPQWTDQNYSDPGITIVELLAWIAEMDIFHLSQITDAQRLKFLALVGIAPRPPLPAHAVLSFTPAGATSPTLPAGLEFSGNDPSGNAVRFRTLREITLAPGSLAALQYKDVSGFHDLTPAWLRGRTMNPFGMAPIPGVEFYMGFSAAFPVNQEVQIFLTFGDGHSSWEDRCRLLRESEHLKKLCQPPQAENPCAQKSSVGSKPTAEAVCDRPAPQHYGVRTVWEYLTTSAGQPTWVALDPSKKQVVDDTRAFTLDGTVTFRVPGPMTSTAVGAVATQYSYVRCRFEAGSYDAAPVLLSPAFNGVASVQSVPAAMSFPISIGATVRYASGSAPNPGEVASLTLALDSLGNITQLDIRATATGTPQFDILNFQAPTATAAGLLCTNGIFLGLGDGTPSQQFTAPNAPVEPGSFRLYSLENRVWHEWQLRPDFDASTRKDWHAVLDATAGALAFGNGENGRVPPVGAEIFAFYLTTVAADANLAAQTINALADSPHNRAALYNPAAIPNGWTQLQGELANITNLLAAAGGTAAETVSLAAGRADQLVETSGRCVTLADYERLAMQTPGTRIARVAALANLHPSSPCYFAPGIITVIVLPYLPQGSPTPTPGLLDAVSAYLQPRRVIGTRVEVVGPTYLQVAVQATVQSKTGTNPAALQQAIVTALNNFLDPLIGGPDGTGWPFGRDVYRAEIMKVIDAVPGVDYIVSMALLADGGQAQCGNVCLSPTWLVQAGAHQITVQ